MDKTKHPFLYDLKHNRVKWLMLLPAAVTVILMCYIPMAGIVLAFKEFNYHDGIFASPWVGLENFRYFSSRARPGRQRETPSFIILRSC